MGTISKRPLKLYMRYDGTGKLISGSAVWRTTMPKLGHWVQITQAYECCNTTTTTIGASWPVNPTCYYVTLNGSIVATTTWSLVYCGDEEATVYVQDRAQVVVCLSQVPVLVSGIGTYTIGSVCEETTTTTTTVP